MKVLRQYWVWYIQGRVLQLGSVTGGKGQEMSPEMVRGQLRKGIPSKGADVGFYL